MFSIQARAYIRPGHASSADEDLNMFIFFKQENIKYQKERLKHCRKVILIITKYLLTYIWKI